MKTVTKRELNQQTARVLAEVEEGETVLVTERGVVRWRIEAVGAEPDPIARLRAQGRIIPAKDVPTPWPSDDVAADPTRIDTLYAWSRGDH